MEAMSYSIPALATDAGGNHEIVTAETGYPIGLDITPESLCSEIEKITSDTDVLCAAMLCVGACFL
jgi:glycosyltransferase involved in cell wall biosynthesis